MRARTDITTISADLLDNWDRVKANLPEAMEEEVAHIETFIAIALRVIAKTNPSKVRDAAMTVEIQYMLKNNQEKALERN